MLEQFLDVGFIEFLDEVVLYHGIVIFPIETDLVFVVFNIVVHHEARPMRESDTLGKDDVVGGIVGS